MMRVVVNCCLRWFFRGNDNWLWRTGRWKGRVKISTSVVHAIAQNGIVVSLAPWLAGDRAGSLVVFLSGGGLWKERKKGRERVCDEAQQVAHHRLIY